MERITIILITEKERLALREDITATFRRTGDPMLYLFPPCIVLGKASEIRRRITVPDTLTLTEETGANDWGSYRVFAEDDAISRMQEELGLPRIPTGLHISYDPEMKKLLTGVKSVRCHALAEALFDGHSFRMIRQKRL